MTAPRLRLAHSPSTLVATRATGPGLRLPLFVQGCRLRCTRECLNPAFLDPGAGEEHDPGAVVDALRLTALRAPEALEGVTILGGEPIEQAAALLPLLRALQTDGLSTMVYTGYRLEDLEARDDAATTALLSLTDLLVDGPYLPAQAAPELLWRGSANQRLLRLSTRYSEQDLERVAADQGPAFSIRGGPDGRVSVVGIQSRGAAVRIERLLGASPGGDLDDRKEPSP